MSKKCRDLEIGSEVTQRSLNVVPIDPTPTTSY